MRIVKQTIHEKLSKQQKDRWPFGQRSFVGPSAAKNSALDWGNKDAIQYKCNATGSLQVSYTYDAWGKPLAATGQGFLNMFAYCNHNPINMIDSAGCLPEWIKGLVKWYVSAIIMPKVEYIEETWAEFHVEITDAANYRKTKFNLFDKIEEYHNLLMGW